MSGDTIDVTGPSTLSNSFLGDTIQVCVVTRDLHRTVQGFVKMGIGPWRVYTFSPQTVKNQTYGGKPQAYSMRLALANSGTMMWEVIEPLEGPSIYKDFLVRHGEGVQHVGQACNGLTFDQQCARLEGLGRTLVQSGEWKGVRYAYYGTEELIGTTIEIFDFPPDFEFPEPEEWIPARPA